jgi:hypothetical protein
MSDPLVKQEQELLDAIHEQLSNAISYNLYTGLAYGMFLLHTPFIPPFCLLAFDPKFGI